jgi:hypothetical protein
MMISFLLLNLIRLFIVLYDLYEFYRDSDITYWNLDLTTFERCDVSQIVKSGQYYFKIYSDKLCHILYTVSVRKLNVSFFRGRPVRFVVAHDTLAID